ncbi:hypothetical protein [Rhizobium ruizarguesonis]|uniref:hypothetical protein n=1 Tax=Rhizobium ruizarguesonis TaxID=2081791 RepID=UPI0010307679|nr:hypothetical protein [Rhizobium ruizarguesonis]TAZ68237.1 hypothetical protein ELH68_32625 [Rhizobium ruizarguesonis]TAZ92267.1 hypothetical protein ELH64_25695 [Rhizobium ruizarguesonis]
MISLRIYGRFRLTGENGEDLTPKSLKARGLLAMLALAPDHCSAREWLQDKLWSDRDAKQGSESLRQTLTIIRRALGEYAHVLRSDREKVSLDPRQFAIEPSQTNSFRRDESDLELFSDLSIRDREFEHWIRNQRLSWAPPPRRIDDYYGSNSRRLTRLAIFFRQEGIVDDNSENTIRTIFSLTTASLLDFSDFQIFHEFGLMPIAGQPPPTHGIVVSIAAVSAFTGSLLYAAIRHSNGRIFWTKTFAGNSSFSAREGELICTIGAEVLEAILNVFRTRTEDLCIPDCAAIFANRGRSLLFQIDRNSLAAADRQLQLAYQFEPAPQYLAWRSFLRNLANFQHRTSSFLDDPIDIETLAREAIHQAPGSAIALSVGAHIEYLSGGSIRNSLLLARRAVGFDPLNAITHAILSNAELVTGNFVESRRLALVALDLAGSGDHRSFVEFFCCMSAAALGDYQVAIDHAETALFLRPSFRAPLRYLIALYKHAGRPADLQRVLTRLRAVEPDFHIGRLLDNNYPVTTLRRIRLIEAISN